MLRHQSKQKETVYGGADTTAPEVSSRIQLLKQRNTPCPAAFTAEFNKSGGQQLQHHFESCWFQWHLGGRRNGHPGDTWSLAANDAEAGRMHMPQGARNRKRGKGSI